MAPLTWQNVEAPNFSAANASMAQAAALMNNSMEGINASLDRFAEKRRKANIQDDMSDVARFSSSTALQGAMADGSYAPRTAEGAEFAAGQVSRLLGQESTRLGMEGQRLQQNVTQWTWDQNKAEADRAAVTRQQRLDFGQQLAPAIALMQDRNTAAEGQKRLNTLLGGPGANFLSPQEMFALSGDGMNTTASGIEQEKRLKETADYWMADTNKNIGEDFVAGLLATTPVDQLPMAVRKSNLSDDQKLFANGYIEKYASTFQTTDDLTYGQGPAASPNFQAGAPAPQPQASQNQALPRSQQVTSVRGPEGTPAHITYQNGGSNRSLSLAPELIQTMDFLPSMGVRLVVTSGGQSSKAEFAAGKAESNGYVGSTRHVHGDAFDGQFVDVQTGRTLSWENDADIPKLQTIVREGMKRGITGVGAGADYMGATTTHMGFGTRAVWGAKGGSPYAAIAEAFNGAASSGVSPQVQKQYGGALKAVAEGKSWEAPIDLTRPRLDNGDGSFSTEETFTTEYDGVFLNIPTVFDGKRHTEDEALEAFQAGINPPVGSFQSVKEAEAAAEKRSAEIGKRIEKTQEELDTPGIQSLSEPQSEFDRIANGAAAPAGTPVGQVTAPVMVPTAATPEEQAAMASRLMAEAAPAQAPGAAQRVYDTAGSDPMSGFAPLGSQAPAPDLVSQQLAGASTPPAQTQAQAPARPTQNGYDIPQGSMGLTAAETDALTLMIDQTANPNGKLILDAINPESNPNQVQAITTLTESFKGVPAEQTTEVFNNLASRYNVAPKVIAAAMQMAGGTVTDNGIWFAEGDAYQANNEDSNRLLRFDESKAAAILDGWTRNGDDGRRVVDQQAMLSQARGATLSNSAQAEMQTNYGAIQKSQQNIKAYTALLARAQSEQQRNAIQASIAMEENIMAQAQKNIRAVQGSGVMTQNSRR